MICACGHHFCWICLGQSATFMHPLMVDRGLERPWILFLQPVPCPQAGGGDSQGVRACELSDPCSFRSFAWSRVRGPNFYITIHDTRNSSYPFASHTIGQVHHVSQKLEEAQLAKVAHLTRC